MESVGVVGFVLVVVFPPLVGVEGVGGVGWGGEGRYTNPDIMK